MRNNIKKPENQFPSMQGRAEDQVTILRATLFHLEGYTSEIYLTIPKYSGWSDCELEGSMFLSEYVNALAAFWVKIEKFSIEVVKIEDGKFKPVFKYLEDRVIPENMVWVRGSRGKFMPYSEALAKSNEAILKGDGGMTC